MNAKDAVVSRFEELIEERNISINELAVLSGVTPSTAYSMFLPERRDISIITIHKFCDGLNITLNEFFDSEIFKSIESEIQ